MALLARIMGIVASITMIAVGFGGLLLLFLGFFL